MARNVSSWSSLSCLPDEMVLNCLARVPRRYYENISCVSVRLRSLVRTPELYRMRSLLHKNSIYVCFCDRENYSTDATYLWFTLRPTTATMEYQLVPLSFPSHNFMFRASTVAVDSEIYFVGGRPNPTELWILDTRSGKLRQGPIKPEFQRIASSSAVGVFDGKIHVIQDLKQDETEEQVYDLETQTWKVVGVPVPDEKADSRPNMVSSVSLEGKVYAKDFGSISVYNLRQGTRKEKLELPIDDRWVSCMCVANNVLFAFFTKYGLLWLDTKLNNVWRVVTGDVQTLHRKLYGSAMAEYYGKLAIFWRERYISTSINTTKNNNNNNKKKEEKIWSALIALNRVGDGICGTIEWSGVVATIPYICQFLHCLPLVHSLQAEVIQRGNSMLEASLASSSPLPEVVLSSCCWILPDWGTR
ncbi:F-box-like domain superfamily [Arabidopsis thaliana x Arabidopsis arenosa]|uniref:F-box-like domain superfamily n=1 Tax=Arabidopsis thaliana x Arabidopsis arenosa TaxID=1240361 RepID=A0A8T2FVP1_9BRAS|nr:F-box-like domain superfamily [Arabidopsis thaliana x Arabidopsis arenosa]